MYEFKAQSTSNTEDTKLKIQFRIVKKILQSILIVSKNKFPELLIYQITKFLIQNPVRVRKILYSRTPSNQSKVNTQYMLRRTIKIEQNYYQDFIQGENIFCSGYLTKKAEKQKQKDKVWVSKDKNIHESTAFITIVRNFKAMNLEQNSYGSILQKARHLFIFLSNIKLFSDKYIQVSNETNPLQDFYSYQKKQKERKLYHHLICDDFQKYYNYFQEVNEYQKQKVMHPHVIKAFQSLMTKNMALIRIEKNYNTQSLQCESKYLYIENKDEFPLKFIKTFDQSRYPALRNQKGQWCLVEQRGNYNFELYQEVSYPLPWGRHSYKTSYMRSIRNLDIWIEEEQIQGQ